MIAYYGTVLPVMSPGGNDEFGVDPCLLSCLGMPKMLESRDAEGNLWERL